MNRNNTIFLFDVDGTLTPSRLKISPEMYNKLKEAKEKVSIGFVGGSDLPKQKEQIGDNCLELFDFGFPENGVSFYKNNELISQESILTFLGEEKYTEIIEFCLKYIADMKIPKKRGTFLELRKSMLNICPVGRNCAQEERIEFFEADKNNLYRQKMVDELRKRFDKYDMQFSIGGQISIDCFPKGWDKTYCLRHLKNFAHIVFFGDMVHKGGNDFEIFEHERTKGVSVTGPEDALKKIDAELKLI